MLRMKLTAERHSPAGFIPSPLLDVSFYLFGCIIRLADAGPLESSRIFYLAFGIKTFYTRIRFCGNKQKIFFCLQVVLFLKFCFIHESMLCAFIRGYFKLENAMFTFDDKLLEFSRWF